MRAVIISGGAIADYDYIKQQITADDTIICADSGYHHAERMQLNVDLLVGDFDSIRCVPDGVATISYPSEKDSTDTELALGSARQKGFCNFLFIAGTGSRMDHTLANIFLLQDCLQKGESAQLLNEYNKIMITDSILSLQEETGALISLIPISDCHGVTTKNLRYPLYEADLSIGSTRGVSNVMLEQHAVVSVRRGTLLVIVAKD